MHRTHLQITCKPNFTYWPLKSGLRWQVPLQDLHLRRQRRLAYQALYAKAHTSCPTFVHPRRRWWQGRGRGSPHMSHREAAHLADLEERLSLSDVAHFRMGTSIDNHQRRTHQTSRTWIESADSAWVSDRLILLCLSFFPPKFVFRRLLTWILRATRSVKRGPCLHVYTSFYRRGHRCTKKTDHAHLRLICAPEGQAGLV